MILMVRWVYLDIFVIFVGYCFLFAKRKKTQNERIENKIKLKNSLEPM